jgi:hypothetical protein
LKPGGGTGFLVLGGGGPDFFTVGIFKPDVTGLISTTASTIYGSVVVGYSFGCSIGVSKDGGDVAYSGIVVDAYWFSMGKDNF